MAILVISDVRSVGWTLQNRIFDLCGLFLHKRAKEMGAKSSTLSLGRLIVSVATISQIVGGFAVLINLRMLQ